MTPLVHILVLNWKSPSETVECVKTIEKQDYQNYRIVIIDNGSPDNSEEILRREFPDYHFIQTGKNLGYAGANNIGIRYAYKNKADFVWILNPDVRVSPSSLRLMVQTMQADPKIGVCGPRLFQGLPPEFFIFDGMHYRDFHFDRSYNKIENPVAPDRLVKYVDDIVGCSILIRMKLFEKIGLFREDFFLYCEETDFNFRARKNHWKVAISPQAQDTHLWSWHKKTEKDHYFYRRNEILLSRIHKRNILKAIFFAADIQKLSFLLRKFYIRTAIRCLFKIKFRRVLAGLLKPIQPIPRLK